MPDYIFKTYIDGGREYYEYTDAADREQTIKKDFPFPESLMSLLYMDIWELEPITKRVDKALLAFYQSGAKDDLQVVAAGLDELASRHVYFELLRLDWLERLDMVDSTAPRDFQDLLPHKKISHLCSSIDTMQKQIKGLIAQVLDMDGEKKSVSEKMVAYYNAEGGDTLNTFQFQPQSMSFEVIDHKVFAEVLYPRDIYDLIDFHVRECVKRARPARSTAAGSATARAAPAGRWGPSTHGRSASRATRCSRNTAGSTKSVSPASMPAG